MAIAEYANVKARCSEMLSGVKLNSYTRWRVTWPSDGNSVHPGQAPSAKVCILLCHLSPIPPPPLLSKVITSASAAFSVVLSNCLPAKTDAGRRTTLSDEEVYLCSLMVPMMSSSASIRSAELFQYISGEWKAQGTALDRNLSSKACIMSPRFSFPTSLC